MGRSFESSRIKVVRRASDVCFIVNQSLEKYRRCYEWIDSCCYPHRNFVLFNLERHLIVSGVRKDGTRLVVYMSKIMRHYLASLLIFSIFNFCQFAEAHFNVNNTERLFLPVDVSAPAMEAETSKRLQPKTAVTGESGDSVASKIVDNTLTLWWETTPLRQSPLGRTAEKVEKNMKAEASFGKTSPTSTEHVVGIKFLAMQSLARLEYRGWVRAGINYNARAASTEAEVLESIDKNKDLVISHLIKTDGSKSQVSFRWNW